MSKGTWSLSASRTGHIVPAVNSGSTVAAAAAAVAGAASAEAPAISLRGAAAGAIAGGDGRGGLAAGGVAVAAWRTGSGLLAEASLKVLPREVGAALLGVGAVSACSVSSSSSWPWPNNAAKKLFL